jgi:iron-sulfur cluster assembly protein
MRQRCDAERGIEAASLFGMNLENVPLHPLKRVFLLQLSSITMIQVNDTARNQVQKLLSEDGCPEGSFVRVGVKGGGCSGLMYQLDFDHEMKDDDQVFEDNGVKVVVDKKSFLYLVGTELRYSGGLNGKGFEFHNPNANRTCGCGESFSL